MQKLAGHSDVRLTTQTYAHVQAEAPRRAVGVLDRIELDGEEEARAPVTARQQLLEGVVGKPVGVQVSPSVPSQFLKGIRIIAEFYFLENVPVHSSRRSC